ncbi:MAG: type II 3-dehydroquinate dehydratase [Acidiferrobacterales bacterium]|jgi:3-dehydroquinate dehydratase-2|nr:type II 3-dehydroquinate dehydratase [Acidiferrobacterales bacterium]
MAKVLVINGPNLNLLGKREPEIYGHETLADIEHSLVAQGKSAGHEVLCFQSNAEHELIDRIHAAMDEGVAHIIINAGAYTHTSIALRDALVASGIPFTEVHISDVHAREAFRHHSYLSDVASNVIVGKGVKGYAMALEAVINNLTT